MPPLSRGRRRAARCAGAVGVLWDVMLWAVLAQGRSGEGGSVVSSGSCGACSSAAPVSGGVMFSGGRSQSGVGYGSAGGGTSEGASGPVSGAGGALSGGEEGSWGVGVGVGQPPCVGSMGL